MVEFAVSGVLLVLLIAAVLDVARGVWYQGTLDSAVAEGTRYAMVHGSSSSSPIGPTDGTYTAGPPSSDSSVTTVVDNYLPGLPTSSVRVGANWPGASDAPGDEVTVTASYPFTPFFHILNFGTITLSATSTETIVH